MLPDSSFDCPHVGFAIGRSLGPAVERNRARRRLREIVRVSDLGPGLYLFGLTGPARETTFATLQRAVEGLIARSGLSRVAGT